MRHTFLVGCALVLTTLTASAQERPDFSGTWAVSGETEPPLGPGRPAPPVFGQQFSIDHQGQALTLTRNFGARPTTVRYPLDGSEVSSRVPGRLCEPDSGATWTAAWDANVVAIAMTSILPPTGKPVKMDIKSSLRMESTDTLRVEVVSRTPAQATPRTTTTIYKRTGSPAAPAPPPVQPAKATIADVAWISGVWIGSSGPSTFEERWTPTAAGSMMSISRTLRDGAMSAFEFLCIAERDGGLVYSAMPNGRMPATDFTLTKIDADNAIFENPAHDFPKMIRYSRKADGSLEAVVSGENGQKPQTFLFKRQ